MKMSIPNAAIC